MTSSPVIPSRCCHVHSAIDVYRREPILVVSLLVELLSNLLDMRGDDDEEAIGEPEQYISISKPVAWKSRHRLVTQ